MDKNRSIGIITIIGLAGAIVLFVGRSRGLSGFATGADDAEVPAGCGGDSSYTYPDSPTHDAEGQVVALQDEEDTDIADFAEDFADAACNLYDECNELVGQGGYDSCVDSVEEHYFELSEDGDCDYDASAANACLRELDDMVCDDIGDDVDRQSACFQVCGAVPVWEIF